MNDNQPGGGGAEVRDLPKAVGEATSVEDPQVMAAVEEYAARLRAGESPPRQALLDRFPALAQALAECLDGLEFVWAAGSGLEPAGVGGPGGRTLGDFRLVREIGRGGMGIVFEAEQISLGRRVALKILPHVATLDSRQLQRFLNEAKAAACLHHPHIVPVYAVGCEGGIHYFAMQFIEGRTLALVLDQLKESASAEPQKPAPTAADSARQISSGSPCVPGFPTAASPEPGLAVCLGLFGETSAARPGYFRRVAEVGIQAARALDHAHQLGVIHRDIKPGNLMLDGQGTLWVTDFGLAHKEGEHSLTLTGDLVGTFRYMAPEQAQARHGLVDHRVDIYGLGATLYELLTLKPAITGQNRTEILRQIAEEEPVAVRRLNSQVPVDLETITLKALAKEPPSRYATAQELADDLQRWLKDEPIVARRPTPLEKASKWAHRNRKWVGGGILFLMLTLVVLAINSWFLWRGKRETQQALQQAEGKTRWARQAVNDMYTEVAEKWLKPKPELAEVECRFLRNALKFYEELAQEKVTTPEERLELAQAYRRIGDIAKILWDQKEKGEPALKQAVVILDSLVRDYPDQAGYRLELARSESELGSYLWTCVRFEEAEQRLLRSLELSKQLVKEAPEKLEYWQQLAASSHELGELWRITHRFPEAEKKLLEAMKTYLWLVDCLPGDLVLRYRLGLVYLSQVDLLMERGRFPYAGTMARQAIQVYEGLPENSPFTRETMKNLGGAYNALAAVLLENNQLEDAERASERSLHLRRREVADFPHYPQFHHGLALTCSNRGRILRRLERPTEAVQAWQEALNHQERVVQRFPHSTTCRQELAIMYGNLAWLQACGPLSIRSSEKALELVKKGRELIPNQKGWLPVLQGVAWYRLGKWQEARTWLSDLILEEGSPLPGPESWTTDVPFLRRDAQERDRQSYPLALFFLAMSDWQLGEKERARQWYAKAVQAMAETKVHNVKELWGFRNETAQLLGMLEQLPAPKEVP